MTTYIKLEDAKNKIIEIKTRIFDDLDQYNGLEIAEIIFNEINSLPTINPESMIEEMIDKVLKNDDPYELELPDYRNNPTASLQELLQRFKS